MKNNSSGQTLFLVIIIMTIFASIVVTIAAVTSRGLETRELEEASLKTIYAADTAMEAASYALSKGYSLEFNGEDDSYVDVKYEGDRGLCDFNYQNVSGRENPNNDACLASENKDGKTCLIDCKKGTKDQTTIEFWFKINEWPDPDDRGFAVILGRGSTENLGIGRDFEIAISGENPPSVTDDSWKYCPKRLHFRAYTISPVPQYAWFPLVRTLSTSECKENGLEYELEENKWYHVIFSYVESLPAFYVWLDAGDQVYVYGQGDGGTLHVAAEASVQGGNFPIRIGKPIVSDENIRSTRHYYEGFNGAIDGLRIYKHPRYCGNPPTFWTDNPSDPYLHQQGMHDYELYGLKHDRPCCGTLFCGNNCNGGDQNIGCGSYSLTKFRNRFPFPENYDMEKHDLILTYNFLEAFGRCADNKINCLRDGSGYKRRGEQNGNDGTIGKDVSFGSPGAPRLSPLLSSYLPEVPIKQGGEMNNGYTYEFQISARGVKIDEGSDPCERDYCVYTSARSF